MDKTIEVMDALWKYWGITAWEELEIFLRNDVSNYFKEYHKDTKIILQKKIACIVEYARNNKLFSATTMRDIIDAVDKQ